MACSKDFLRLVLDRLPLFFVELLLLWRIGLT